MSELNTSEKMLLDAALEQIARSLGAICNCGFTSKHIAEQLYSKCSDSSNRLISWIATEGNYLPTTEVRLDLYNSMSVAKRLIKMTGSSPGARTAVNTARDQLISNNNI